MFHVPIQYLYKHMKWNWAWFLDKGRLNFNLAGQAEIGWNDSEIIDEYLLLILMSRYILWSRRKWFFSDFHFGQINSKNI